MYLVMKKYYDYLITNKKQIAMLFLKQALMNHENYIWQIRST